jgi:hypothetical protein
MNSTGSVPASTIARTRSSPISRAAVIDPIE